MSVIRLTTRQSVAESRNILQRYVRAAPPISGAIDTRVLEGTVEDERFTIRYLSSGGTVVTVNGRIQPRVDAEGSTVALRFPGPIIAWRHLLLGAGVGGSLALFFGNEMQRVAFVLSLLGAGISALWPAATSPALAEAISAELEILLPAERA